MPRIRDLGINSIPLTMQPPEIGGGAADRYACSDSTKYGDVPCAPTNCIGVNCAESTTVTCDQSGVPSPTHQCDEQSNCQEHTCGPPDKPHRTAAFNDAAVRELKQQLHDQLGQAD